MCLLTMAQWPVERWRLRPASVMMRGCCLRLEERPCPGISRRGPLSDQDERVPTAGREGRTHMYVNRTCKVVSCHSGLILLLDFRDVTCVLRIRMDLHSTDPSYGDIPIRDGRTR